MVRSNLGPFDAEFNFTSSKINQMVNIGQRINILPDILAEQGQKYSILARTRIFFQDAPSKLGPFDAEFNSVCNDINQMVNKG